MNGPQPPSGRIRATLISCLITAWVAVGCGETPGTIKPDSKSISQAEFKGANFKAERPKGPASSKKREDPRLTIPGR